MEVPISINQSGSIDFLSYHDTMSALCETLITFFYNMLSYSVTYDYVWMPQNKFDI